MNLRWKKSNTPKLWRHYFCVLGHCWQGQYENSNCTVKFYLIVRLGPWADKVNQIPRCYWLLEQARWHYLPFLWTTRCVLQEKPWNKSFIDQACSFKMAGYWPHSCFASLWTSTPSWSINSQKMNLANIQPSWPHTWSITHIKCLLQVKKFIRENSAKKHFLLRKQTPPTNAFNWVLR